MKTKEDLKNKIETELKVVKYSIDKISWDDEDDGEEYKEHFNQLVGRREALTELLTWESK